VYLHLTTWVSPSLATKQEAEYNAIYSAYYGGPSTLEQILEREAIRVVRDNLLALRFDSHMMHQVSAECELKGCWKMGEQMDDQRQ
jgi:hypothetical protein